MNSSWIGRTLPNGLSVLEKVGSSSDGMLYRARRSSGQEVALLILGTATAGGGLSAGHDVPLHRHPLFLQAARIRHLNVAAIHELGEMPGGSSYMVLEFLTGEPLSDLLAQQGALPETDAVELFLQAAAGVAAAHEVGLVHANLSPDNFLVTRTAGGPLVKLIRFAPLAWSSTNIGEASVHEAGGAYASPERLAGHPPDARSDVYSLGAILHHMLAGSPPAPGSDAPGSNPMRGVVTRAIHPIRELRFQTVSGLIKAVQKASALATGSGRTRSRRPLVVVAAGIVAILAGGVWLGASTPRGAPSAGGPAPRAETGAVLVTPPPPVAETADSVEMEPPEAKLPSETPPKPAKVEALAADSVIEGYRPMEDSAADSAIVDTGTAALPPPPAAFLTLEERAQVDHRIGLDEVREALGEPAHGIEGMSQLFIGLASGGYPDGADTSLPLVRAVYLSPDGELILLDQQRAGAGPAPAGGTGIRWAIGEVMLYLHGEGGTAMLANLVKRVR